MCGIAGIISQQPERRIGAMLQSIEHRGRDDEGVWTSASVDAEGRRVCLGHRRLSIIDTSEAGHQPMQYADGRYSVTFNGEIYNYRELRKELEKLNHRFRTDCDTEVLLAAYAEWGTNSLARLNGMFAFALWDEAEQELLLARDRLGIKPLYYAFGAPDENGAHANDASASQAAGASFVFASEIKALLATGLVRRALDREALDQYLTFLWTPDPHTVFQGIRKLPPAHVLTWRAGEIEVREWWDVSFAEIEEGRSEKWWREQVLETLERVVSMARSSPAAWIRLPSSP